MKNFYLTNNSKRRNQSDINNNDNLNRYKPCDFYISDYSAIEKEDNIYQKYFDFKKKGNIKKNKNDNNRHNLKKNEFEDKNMKMILSRANNFETDNFMRTNYDEGLKDLAIKKKESDINLKNNKSNCIII